MRRASFFALATSLVLAAPLAAQGDSLTLAGALELARAHSPVLAEADAGLRGAGARVRQAGAARAPRLGVNAAYLRFQDPPTLSLGPAGSFSPIPQDGYLVQASALYPLYTGGRTSAAARAARWGEQAATESREAAEVELTAAVARAHDAVLFARALLGVAEEGERLLRATRTLAERQYADGAVARLDVLRAETRLSAAQADVRAARGAVADAQERLAVLIGLAPDQVPPAAGSLDFTRGSPGAAQVDSLLAAARGSRPDVRALSSAAEGTRARAAAARAGLRPVASVYLSGAATRPAMLGSERRWSTNLFGGVLVSWPVFDFGASGGEAAALRAEADRMQAEATQHGDAAAAEVRSQLRVLGRAAEDVAAGRENVTRAERALAIAQERYADGAGLQIEVLQAEAELVGIRAALLGAVFAHRSALIELRRATGRVTDPAMFEPLSPREAP